MEDGRVFESASIVGAGNGNGMELCILTNRGSYQWVNVADILSIVREQSQSETYTREGSTYAPNDDGSLTLRDSEGNAYTRV